MSLILTCVGSGPAGVVSQPASTHAPRISAGQGRIFCDIAASVQINDLGAPVARPGLFRVPRDGRTLLAGADGRDLRFRPALQQQRAPPGLRPALTQADVVFTRAALVGIAFDAHADS